MVDLKVINIDKYIEKNDETKLSTHYLMPQGVFRSILVGSSNGGKSNLLIDMLTRNKVCYNALYVYSKHIDQDKYLYLKKYITGLEKSLKKQKVYINIIKAWENNLDNLVGVNELDCNDDAIIVIDDFNTNVSKKQKENIADLFCSARHKSTSIFYLGQLYHEIPRPCRLNLSYLFLFDNNNRRELSLLTTELASDKTPEEFRKIYKYALKDKYNFLMIDNTNNELRYRKNFDEILK